MIVGKGISIDNNELSEQQWNRLFEKLTFANDNGEFAECFKIVYTQNRVEIPRGAWNLVSQLDYVDERVRPKMPKLNFNVELGDTSKDKRFGDQAYAVKAMFEYEQGQIIRPPGTGKSQIVLAFAAECETSVLVIVHTEDILNQWIRYIGEAMPGVTPGVIRGSKCDVKQITIGTVQTLKKYLGKDFWKQFGCIVADEAHHGAAPTWEAVLNHSPAYYRFGMTASATRADGMHPALKFIIGPIIHEQKFSSPVNLSVTPIRSSFYYGYRGRFDWMPMLDKLVTDDRRNKKIAEVANDEIRGGNSVLILSRRIEHLERIGRGIEGRVEILTGKRSKADRERILAEFRSGELQCLAATQLADEALDVPRLNRVILTHPGKHEGRIIQQIGRAIRQHSSKHDAVIYDVMDVRVGVLRRQWDERKRTYKKSNIRIAKIGRLF